MRYYLYISPWVAVLQPRPRLFVRLLQRFFLGWRWFSTNENCPCSLIACDSNRAYGEPFTLHTRLELERGEVEPTAAPPA